MSTTETNFDHDDCEILADTLFDFKYEDIDDLTHDDGLEDSEQGTTNSNSNLFFSPSSDNLDRNLFHSQHNPVSNGLQCYGDSEEGISFGYGNGGEQYHQIPMGMISNQHGNMIGNFGGMEAHQHYMNFQPNFTQLPQYQSHPLAMSIYEQHEMEMANANAMYGVHSFHDYGVSHPAQHFGHVSGPSPIEGMAEAGELDNIDPETFHAVTRRREGSDMGCSVQSELTPRGIFNWQPLRPTESSSTFATGSESQTMPMFEHETTMQSNESSEISAVSSPVSNYDDEINNLMDENSAGVKRPLSDDLFDLDYLDDEVKAPLKKKGRKSNRDVRVKKDEKQHRTKWSAEEVGNLWEAITVHGNNWRMVQKTYLPKRTYYQVKDKGRRILTAEGWSSGRTKATHGDASEEAKEISNRVIDCGKHLIAGDDVQMMN